MIASQSANRDDSNATNSGPSSVFTANMGEIIGLQDKNGNLELTREIVATPLADRVCRTCLNVVEPESCVPINCLDPEDKTASMVVTCLSKTNFLLTTDPVICQKCFAKLEDFHDFLLTCSNTETKLVSYCTMHHLATPINLCDIKRKLSEESKVLSVKLEDDDDTRNDTGTIEDVEADIKSEDEQKFSDEASNTDTVQKKKPVKRRKKGIKLRVSKVKALEKKTLFSEDMAEASVKCETCNKKFPSKWALDRHSPVHNEERKFICETCSMSFRYKHSFQKHLLAHVNGAPAAKPFACECGKFFSRKAKLKKHEQIHVKKEKLYACEHCGKRFIDQESLSSHIFRVHASEKAFSCEVCGNKYSSKSGLDVHFKTHFPSDKPKPEPDLMCDFCGKLFYRKYSLEKHRMSHTGDKPHECEECGMRFKERYQLTIHNRRHTGEKPFDCEICGFKFPSKNRLGVHMRIHTGVRPFPCQMCDMAFTRKDHLIKHVRAIHTGERPFECEVCLKTFNRRDYLIKHKKVHIRRGL